MNHQQIYVENAMVQLEQELHLRITVIDRDGIFNYKQKSEVFQHARHTHQTHPCCRWGFCDACVAHCRHRINQHLLDEPVPYYSVCWKGIGQIAVPLRQLNFNYGILYAGNFRAKDAVVPEGLPPEFYEAFNVLPEADDAKIGKLLPVLHLFALGLITYLREENIVNDEYDFRVRKIFTFLEQNLCRNIGLPDMARFLHLSEPYASLLIKQITGYTFSQLLRSFRITHAKKLLITTEENLRSIALQCGFSNEFHLSKVFKETTGLSPSVFRKLDN